VDSNGETQTIVIKEVSNPSGGIGGGFGGFFNPLAMLFGGPSRIDTEPIQVDTHEEGEPAVGRKSLSNNVEIKEVKKDENNELNHHEGNPSGN
jgi:hypothetical protein